MRWRCTFHFRYVTNKIVVTSCELIWQEATVMTLFAILRAYLLWVKANEVNHLAVSSQLVQRSERRLNIWKPSECKDYLFAERFWNMETRTVLRIFCSLLCVKYILFWCYGSFRFEGNNKYAGKVLRQPWNALTLQLWQIRSCLLAALLISLGACPLSFLSIFRSFRPDNRIVELFYWSKFRDRRENEIFASQAKNIQGLRHWYHLLNLVPRVLSIPRESTLVTAGHVSMHTNQIRIGGGSLTKFCQHCLWRCKLCCCFIDLES